MVQEPLRQDYQQALACCKRDEPRETSRQNLARLANRHWAAVVSEVLAQPSQADAMRVLLLQESDSAEGVNSVKKEVAQTLVDLAVRMAGQRAWSASCWELPPEQWVGILSDDADESVAAFEQMKADLRAVRKGMEASRNPDHEGAKARDQSCGERKHAVLCYCSGHWFCQALKTALGELWVHKLTLVQA